MIKKYCLLDKNGKYLESFSDSEISDNEKKSCIFTSPPNINENKVAFWENDNWKIKRKKIKDDLYDDLLKQLNFDDIKNEVAINNKIIPQRTGNYIATNELLNMLEIERNNYKRRLVNLCLNKQKIPKIYKDYIKELDLVISHYKKIKATYSDYRYDKEDNEFDLGEILDNKYEADLYELSN